jgi:RNA polymerase sigma factor (sigma-70 family)
MLPAVRVEDVLQQTFLGAWSSLRDGAEVRELRPWLYRIAHNAGVNALKRSGYDYEELKESLRSSDGPEGDVERRAVMRETLSAVAGLPERQRRALLETAVEGRSQADVAREMGMSEGAFRQLVHRARTTLRTAATAITPLPMAGWAAAAGSSDAPAGGLATRIAELAAGAGTAGVGATVVKAGAVVVATGALAAGPVGIVGGGSDPASGSLDGKAARSTTNEPLGGFLSGLARKSADVSVWGVRRRVMWVGGRRPWPAAC